MNVLGQDEQEELEKGHQLLNVSFMQGEALPDNWAYLDGWMLDGEGIQDGQIFEKLGDRATRNQNQLQGRSSHNTSAGDVWKTECVVHPQQDC
jgi:hypothetical protein